MRLNMSLSMVAAILLVATSSAEAARKLPKKKSAPVAVDTVAAVAALPASEPDSLFGKIKVGPSQTVSWLAFRHLGVWTPEIAERIKADNPQIQDLDRLEVGQILRFRLSLDQRRLAPAEQIAKAVRKAVATLVKGSVQLQRAGSASSEPLRANEFLSPGDRITTRSGDVVELIIDNQSVLRLRDKAVLTLTAIQSADSTQAVRTSVALDMGRLWSKVRKWAGPLVGFQVKMPNAIAGVHGTTFECFVNADSSGGVTVHEGLVGVWDRRLTLESPVPSGKSVIVNTSGEVTQPIPTKSTTPDWNRFNQQRDQSLEEQAAVHQDNANITHSPLNNADAAARLSNQKPPVLRPNSE
jgi:hypothetical protein